MGETAWIQSKLDSEQAKCELHSKTKHEIVLFCVCLVSAAGPVKIQETPSLKLVFSAFLQDSWWFICPEMTLLNHLLFASQSK